MHQNDAEPLIELKCQGEVLRFPLVGEEFRLGRDRTWSNVEIPTQGWEVLSRRHAIFCKEAGHYRLYDGDGYASSRNGIFLHHTRITTTDGILLHPGLQLEIGQDPRNLIQLSYLVPLSHPENVFSTRPKLDLKSIQEGSVVLGRVESEHYASMVLDAPTVSRHHAVITRNAQKQYILQDTSTNGTFVNQQRIDQPVQLNEGDELRIGPYALLFRQEALEITDRGNSIRLDAHDLFRKVKRNGEEIVILDHLSLAVEPGQLVALVGGSGTGKTTLLKTLLGLEPNHSGEVYLNGDDLEQHFNLYRNRIGYVPQDDIVHQDLTVEEVLTYACKLRLPPDINVEQVIVQTLNQIRLNHVRTSFVRHLSGGQRKRVSIGVELLADPRLFFLDEPTSGLDPGLDKEMMMLLRELADQGRTIILVTHATANIEVCDRIAFLGRGGRLCYFGPPQEATSFFGMPADLKYFADIYLQLEQGKTEIAVQQQVQSWSQTFRNSDSYHRYVETPLSLGYDSEAQSGESLASLGSKASTLRQLMILSQRHLKLVLRDRFSLMLALLVAPLGISLISLALGDKTPFAQLGDRDPTQAPLALRVLLIFTCAAIWVGLSGSIQEIVRESNIYIRERLVNLKLHTYLGSKVLVRSVLAAIQSCLIITAILIQFRFPASNEIGIPWFLGLGVTTFLTLLASTCFGLMVSTIVKNESQASITLPLILLPQIIFSGVLFEFGKFTLENPVSGISWLTVSRWSVGAYGSLVGLNNMVPESTDAIICKIFKENPVYDSELSNLRMSWEFLCLHAMVYLAVALFQQKRKDIKN